MNFNAEIISVGTELLLGNIINIDARDISQLLSEIGINVYYHTVVGDNPQRLRQAVDVAKSRADIIITTGGLGPTYDDLTKQTLCQCFGKELYRDEEIVQGIKDHFSKHAYRKLTENNFIQADLPVGCTILRNDFGTAPGCAFEADGKHVLMLPGPPRECFPMFKNYALPYLMQFSDGEIHSHNIHVFGLGESAMEYTLHDMMLKMTNPTMAPYAKTGEAFLRVTAKAHSQKEADEMMAPVIKEVREILGDVVYGIDTGSLENTVLGLLKEKGLTISAAESCTGGYIAKRLTDIPGSSASFLGGVVSYSNEAKIKILGVNPDDIKSLGAVSDNVAIQMAEGARRLLGSDLALGVTGIAGPGSDSSGKPVGMTYIALSTPDGTYLRFIPSRYGDRDGIRLGVSSTALDMARRYLEGKEVNPEI